MSGFPIYQALIYPGSGYAITYSQPTYVTQIALSGVRGAYQYTTSTSQSFTNYGTDALVEVDYGNGVFVTVNGDVKLNSYTNATGLNNLVSTITLNATIKAIRITPSTTGTATGMFTYMQAS